MELKAPENYYEEDLLMLSGIQHFAFCQRQWALIHIEQQWSENSLTIEGQHLHSRVDDPHIKESHGTICSWRAVNLISLTLGFTGRADVIEFHQSSIGIRLPSKSGFWVPFPVEYKRGKPKADQCDKVQLCAQAMCLEEMFGFELVTGALFYGEIRQRENVSFSPDLRNQVRLFSKEMHRLFESGITPLPDYKPHCKACSLYNICLPKSARQYKDVNAYLKVNLSEPEE